MSPGQQARDVGAWQPYFGATYLGGGRARFRVWAPAMQSVSVDIEGRGSVAMARGQDGVFEAEAACMPGDCYRYRIDADLQVPDPASRLQAGDVHDASVVVPSGGDYVWRHPAWRGLPWTDTVLYEIHAGLAGGYAGIEQRLPDLAELGVTALELMPIADFPGPRNWGYDGVLPYAPDLAYGRREELKRLVDTAHGLGLMVFLDVVYNHFGPDGNYLHRYAPQFFREDMPTPWGPAIDYRRPQVRRFFAENALYWLEEFRFDGLRLDAVHAISDPNWLDEMAAMVRERFAGRRHVHLVLENDRNAASHLTKGYDAQWNDDIHHVLHHLLTGESDGYYRDYARAPAAALARALSQGFVYQGEISPTSGRRRGEPSGHLPPSAFVAFLQNHDQVGNRALGERLAALVSHPDALRAAVALQLLAPQVPLIFMGEECGSTTPFFYFTSHADPQLARAVREGRRNEFSGFAGHADAALRERIPDPNDACTYLASRPTADSEQAQAWRNAYRCLLGLRRRLLAPRLPGSHADTSRPLGSHAVQAAWILGDGARWTIYANLGQAEVTVSAPALAADGCAVVFESRPGCTKALRHGSLPPCCTIALMEAAP